MDNKLFPDSLSKTERIHNLEAMAYAIEEGKYFKKLSVEEVEQKREIFTENVIQISDLNDKKKELINEIKNEIKPLSIENKSLMEAIRTKQEEVEGKIYLVDDQENGMMHSYDEMGELITSRRLRPNEKQTSIFSISKAQ